MLGSIAQLVRLSRGTIDSRVGSSPGSGMSCIYSKVFTWWLCWVWEEIVKIFANVKWLGVVILSQSSSFLLSGLATISHDGDLITFFVKLLSGNELMTWTVQSLHRRFSRRYHLYTILLNILSNRVQSLQVTVAYTVPTRMAIGRQTKSVWRVFLTEIMFPPSSECKAEGPWHLPLEIL